MEFRVLRRPERERLLTLLDRWDVGDGWRGRDFFRRYLEDDPSFADENVWVAVEGDRLVSCVQIFPRELRIRGVAVPMGGIGSVFTAPELRGRGLARELLERAAVAMAAGGMEVSMLFPAPERVDWYRRLGFDAWKRPRLWVSGGPCEADPRVSRFDPERDFEAVRSIHARYSGALDGTEVRAGGLWRASLRNAGNPGEDFWLARTRASGAVVAYARSTRLAGLRVLTEMGRAAGAEEALARVVATAVGDRAVAPGFAHEPGLERALVERGLEIRPLEDPLTMLRCLAPAALGRRTRVSPREGEAPNDFLRRLLPAERLHYWVADRF